MKTRKDRFREQQVRMVAGMVLKLLRETKGLTQEQVATRSGLERTSITNIESGVQGTTLHVLMAISNALEIRAAKVLDQIERLLVAMPQKPVALAERRKA